MAIVHKTIEKVPAILARRILIPPYQRPYKWESRLAGQLLQDLQHHQHKQAYRLGTVVFYRKDVASPREVVDGRKVRASRKRSFQQSGGMTSSRPRPWHPRSATKL